MLVTPSSSPPATPVSPPRTAPGQALSHLGTEEDDHWHDCQEAVVPRNLNFSSLDAPGFPRLISEDMDSARRASQTEPPMTPPCSLPMTPKGSRTASPVGAGPTRLVRRWSRVSGYRTPGTADGFVRCWQSKNDAASSEALPVRLSRPSLAPPVDSVAQREQALRETREMLELCVTELLVRVGNLEAQQQDVWRRLQSALTRTERLLKHVEPDVVLGPLEHKAVVLTFVMEVHILKKKYRRQTAAALKTLLKSESWRQEYLQDNNLKTLGHHAEAEELRALLPPAPAPPPPKLPIPPKEEEAPFPLPIFSQPLSARPTLVTSPTRRAAVDADVKVMRERRARRATRRPGEPLSETLRWCKDQVEALDFGAGGETDEVQVAFETFHRAVRQAFGKTSATDFTKGLQPVDGDQKAELESFEPKPEMVQFLKDVWAKRKVMRARVACVLNRLESLDAWKAVLDATPEVKELLNPLEGSPTAMPPSYPNSPSNFSEPEPEVSSTSRAADCAEEPTRAYTAFGNHEEEDLEEELEAKVRREGPWYLRMCVWLIGLNRTMRFCKCLVPSRIHREVQDPIRLTKSEKLHLNDVLKASGSPARL